MKNWEEMTKLETKTRISITLHICIAVLSIVTAFVMKNNTWVICGMLWILIAVQEYCDSKIMKGKDALIEIQEEHIKVQNNMIDDLFKKLNDRNRTVKLVDIKIPEHFTKPRKDKLKRRTEFFNKNKCFATPIVIDKETMMLLDGYTSYLIAKKYNFEVVQVEEV